MVLKDLVPKELILKSKVDLTKNISHITQSAKDTTSDSLFFAIKGHRFDGHQYLTQALKSKACAIVEDKECFEKNENTILVASSRKAFGIISSKYFFEPTKKIKLVGVTGTNGKTTTTFLLRSIWKKLQIKTGLIGTIQCEIGDEISPSELTTPDAYFLQEIFSKMVQKNVSHAAMEVSSIALDQYRTYGSFFSCGIFSNFTQDHLDYHQTMENYFLSKLKFFEQPMEIAIINIDDPYGVRILETLKIPKISYSLKDTKSDFFARNIHFKNGFTECEVHTPAGFFNLRFPLLGYHNVYNMLSVLSACYHLEFSLDKIISKLEDIEGAPGRLELVHALGPQIFVDYAHTPDALENVLKILTQMKNKNGKLITVFGCGGDRDKLKRPKMAKIASHLSDFVIITSDNPRTEDPEEIMNEIEQGMENKSYTRILDRKKAIYKAMDIAEKQDLILIAGKGHENYQIIGDIKYPFDDKIVVKEYV